MDLIRMARHMVGETDDPHEVSTGDDGVTVHFYNDETPTQVSLTLPEAQAQLPKATAVEPQMSPLAAANARYDAHPPEMQTAGEQPLLARIAAVYRDQGPEIARDLLRGLVRGGKEGLAQVAQGTADLVTKGPVGMATDFGLNQAPQLVEAAKNARSQTRTPGGRAEMTDAALRWLNDPANLGRVSGNLLATAGTMKVLTPENLAAVIASEETGAVRLRPGGGTLGESAKRGGASVRAARAAAKADAEAAALESAEPAPAPPDPLADPTLLRKYPQTAKALRTHGTPVTLEGTNRSLSARLDRMVNDIYQRTLKLPGTTTYPLTGEVELPSNSAWGQGGPVTNTGTMMGKYSNQSGKTPAIPLAQFTPADVRNFLETHADTFAKNPDLTLGTWVETDKVTGAKTVFLDVAKKHETVRQATMNAWTQKQPPTTVRDPVTGQWPLPQKAGFNLETGNEPPVGNLAEYLRSDDFKQRLDTMYAHGTPLMNGEKWWQLAGSSLERVYGKERIKQLAGTLAATSPGTPPVHNLRAATEYMRRLITQEPLVQPKFKIPQTAVGSLEGHMGGVVPGDFNSPGTQMPMEAAREGNLQRVERGEGHKLQLDKVNDMYHALIGEPVGVYDRHYAKLVEDWEKGIYAETESNKLEGSMLPEKEALAGKKGKVSSYALVENAMRDAAKANGVPLDVYTANVWEGIRDTIKTKGELFGMKHVAHAIPDASGGFPKLFDQMVAEKAAHMGMSVPEFEAGLRAGKYELLALILATPAGLAALHQWQQQGQKGPA